VPAEQRLGGGQDQAAAGQAGHKLADLTR
jgi:hypothetical protein